MKRFIAVIFSLLLVFTPCFGAANMVLGGLTVDVDGNLVGTLSPCVSPLTPSTGVSGITLANLGNPNAQTVVATLTALCGIKITTYQAASSNFPAMIDDPIGNIAVSISTGSNLTDASGNTVSATGNTNVAPTVNNSTWVPVMGTFASTHLRCDANPAIDSRGSTVKGAAWMTMDGGCRWTSDVNVTGFNVLGFNFSNILTSFQDRDTALVTQSQTSGANWTSYALGTGLSGAHTYEVFESNPTNQGNNGVFAITAIQLVGGTFGAQPAYRPWNLCFGASEMQGNNGGSFNGTQGYCWDLNRRMGYADQSLGIAGWPVTTNTACMGVGCTTHDYTGATLLGCSAGATGQCSGTSFPKGSDAPFSIIPEPGGNDALDNTLIGSNYTTAGTVKGDSVTLLGNLVTRFGAPTSGKMYSPQQYCPPGVGTCTAPASNPEAPYQAAWAGAAAAYNALATGVTVVSTPTFLQGLTNPTNGAPDFLCTPTCGLHLTVAGNANWANGMLPVLAGISGPSYSTSGSLTGTAGAPSTSVTITLNGVSSAGTAAFFSTGNSGITPQTITLTSTNGSDTFAITGGSGGSTCASPCTVTPTNGAGSWSYKVTAATSGSRTITMSNGQGAGWIDPTPLAYNAGTGVTPTFAPIF